jgi:hypothetical protein
MAGDLGLCHGEAHVGEEPAGSTLGDGSLRLLVWLGRGSADDVEAEVPGDAAEVRARDHAGHRSTGG